ncbi:hypothetical protein [Agathobaculum sp. Marseille-P7918]|uniref:hypothetical protein n=1 Tax=Agathobaculum sp. Marseille-P7918 TaxID=2479843 RepID=UPI00356A1ACD
MILKTWELRENEKLLEEAAASYITKRMIVMPKPNPGKLHITNQRVVFTDALTLFFDYPLDQVVSFSKGMGNLTLMTTDGKKHKLTGMFIKKLSRALEEAGVKNA